MDVDNVETGSTLQETNSSRVDKNIATVAPTHTASSYKVDKCKRISSQNTLLSKTKTSRVVKRTVSNSTVRAMKICRHLDNVTAAKSWRTEANILKLLNHVRLTLFQI